MSVKERRLRPAETPFLASCRVSVALRSETFVRLNGDANQALPVFCSGGHADIQDRPNTGETRTANRQSRFKTQRGAKKIQGNGLGHYFAARLRGSEIGCVRLAHFVADGQRRKGQRHHERQGKDYRVHMAIVSHIGQLQQFCYNYVTFLWLLVGW